MVLAEPASEAWHATWRAHGSWRNMPDFPLGTFVINVTVSFVIGLLMTLLTERFHPHPHWRLFLVVGVLGGYTTFSSFEFEAYQAVRDGARWMGMLYLMGSFTGLSRRVAWRGARGAPVKETLC